MMIRRLHVVLLLCLLCLLMSHQSLAGSWRRDVADERHRALAKEKQFDPVCLMMWDGKPNASGVLIDPHWVLTAGHEVIGRDAKRGQVQIGDRTYGMDRIVLHPDYEEKTLGHGVDLALVRLAEPCRDVTPARLYEGDDELGRPGHIVGYGRSGAGREIITNPGPVGTKRAGVNVIDAIGGTVKGRTLPDNFLVADFDHPDKPDLNVTGEPKAHELEYCPVGGDSGGGLFIEVDDRWHLAAITSSFNVAINDDLDDGIHGSVIHFIRLSVELDWIRSAIGHE